MGAVLRVFFRIPSSNLRHGSLRWLDHPLRGWLVGLGEQGVDMIMLLPAACCVLWLLLGNRANVERGLAYNLVHAR